MLQFEILEHGDTICSREWGMKGEFSVFSRVYFSRNESAVYKAEEQHLRLLPNHLYIFPSFTTYDLQHDISHPLNVLWFHVQFYPPIIGHPVVINVSRHKELSALISALCEVRKNAVDGSCLQELFSICLRYVYTASPDMQRTFDPRINQVLSHISNNLSTPVHVALLADIAHMERAYFSRRFTSLMSVSPQQYIIRVKMSHAAKLIRQGIPLDEVCHHVGYSSYKTFSETFHKTVGISPYSYQKNCIIVP